MEAGETTDENVAATVLRLRAELGLTQAQLGQLMRERGWKWNQTTIWQIEHATRAIRLAEAVDLAQILGIRVDDLVASPILAAHMRFREELRMRDRELDTAVLRRSDAESRVRRLHELSRLADGAPLYWGEPATLLRDLLGNLQDAHVEGILLEIGLSAAELESIRDSDNRWAAMWGALHSRYPNFRDASAVKRGADQ